MLRDIYLYGRLARLYGHKHALDVETPAEAVRALCTTRPGFRQEFEKSAYRVVRGKAEKNGFLDQNGLRLRMGRERELHIIPTPAVGGTELVWYAVILVAAVVLAVAFTPTITPPDPSDREDDKNSFVFDGAVNSMEQGHPVPLVFGRFEVGSVVVSAGIQTTRLAVTPGYPGSIYTDGWYGTGGPLDLVQISKGKSGGGQSRAAQEDPNSLQSQATAKIVEVLCEGEIRGPAKTGLQWIKYDGTPVENIDGTFNFKGVNVQYRLGLPDQEFISGFTQQESSRTVDREVSQMLGAVVQTITDDDVNRARVTLTVNGFYQQDTATGDLKNTDVAMKFELQSSGGGYTELFQHTISGKQTGTYQEDFEIELAPGGHPYDIRVSRASPDNLAANYVDDVYWGTLTEIIDAKLTYPDSALVAMDVDAKQFGSKIPTRTYDIYGLICEVPTNYNTETRVYATSGPGTSGGIWDGTFKREWTDDGAWCFRELCLNKRWGVGRKLGVTGVDKWALYEISKHNSERVPNGLGGEECRYALNCVINTRAKAQDVLTTVAGTFRSTIYWGAGGQVVLVQDRPEDAARLINQTNVVDEVFDYETIDIEDKFSAYIVAWNDPEDGYRIAYEVVEDKALRKKIGWKAESVTAWGETRRGGAARYGRRLLHDQEYSESATYSSGFDQATLNPGDVIKLVDPENSPSRLGGRIISSTSTTITLDYPVAVFPGCVLEFILPDGSIGSRVLTNAAGTATVMTFASALATQPMHGAVFALTTTVEPTRWRIVTRGEDDGVVYPFKVRQYNPGQWVQVEQNLKLDPATTSDIPTGQLAAPGAISYTEFVKVLSGDTGSPSILVSWPPSGDARVTAFQVQLKRPGGSNYEEPRETSFLSMEYNAITAGEHSIRVRSIDAIGHKSAWRVLTDTFDGLPAAPSAVQRFDAYPGEDGVRFVWQPVTSITPLVYEIRQGPDWEAAQRICRVRDDTITVKLPTSLILDQQFWIKPYILGSELYSADATLATTYQAPLPTRNVIVSNNFRTAGGAWDGALFRLQEETLSGQQALRLKDDPGGVRYAFGDYRTTVDIGSEAVYARNWIEKTVRNVSANSASWDSLTVSWDDLGTLTWDVPDGSLNDVRVDTYIAVDDVPSSILEAWSLDATLNGEVASTAIDIAVLATVKAPSLFGEGRDLDDYSLLGWEDDVPFPSAFTYKFDFQPKYALAIESVLATLTNGTQYLQLGYDPVTDVLFLEDELSNRLEMPFAAWDSSDIYTLCVVQTATKRKIVLVSQDDPVGVYVETTRGPSVSPYDTVYLGSGGAGVAETWLDAGYTWADTEAGRTWAELSLVLFATPGVYARAELRSTDLFETTYATALYYSGGAGFGDFRALVPGDYNYERAIIWQRLSAPTGVGDKIYLTESVLQVDVPDIVDGGSATLTAAATVINFGRSFHAAPIVVAVHKGGATPAVANIVSVGLTSFTVKLVSSTSPSTLVAGDINWSAKGY